MIESCTEGEIHDIAEAIRREARNAALAEAAKIAADYDPNRAWSSDSELQNMGYYAAGEASYEIEEKILAKITNG